MGTFFLSDFIPFTGWIDTLRGLHARLERSFNEMDKFYQKFIDEHMDSNEKTQAEKDIVDVVLQLKKNDSSSIDLTNDNIKGLLMNILLGATETTALTTLWAMTELLKNPSVMKKVQEEISSLSGQKAF
ncbi:hypothetical protein JHK85_006361 [Glycine max]|nr:hypothetical protein JHK85_006361 [Glycine max]